MDINELESFKLSDAVTFHDQLNPALWTEKGELEPDVKKQLMLIARDFMSELGISSLKVEDITISGSSAAYTYTPHSDLDLHILVDFNKLPDDEVYQELFNAKKTLYNDTHDIKVHGVPVELYVQDSNQPVVSLGEYSILKNEWLKIPKKRRANFDQNATKAKYEKLGEMVELALKSQDLEKIEKALSIIKRYRKAGLDTHGEFGPENLAFKALRSQGYIKKLYDLKNELHSRKLSIESAMDEDWHPNDTPPGPEFKPTMPKGTVRVDVSDVYDWYKLGQHISNLKGLGKHDFGKGPPSTILSFGDEDLEHQYIDALKKTGLDTTDIDPVDPNQPKGMKRQKVDPTYNVNEAFDQPYRLKWEAGDYGDVDAYAKLDDGTYLSIMFNKGYNQDKEEAWNVEFFRNNSQEVTGEGDQQRVFATVLSAIQKFIKKYKPNKVIFSASKEVDDGQKSQSRARLYDSLVQRYARAWGFRAFRADTSNKVIYELSKIKKDVAEDSSNNIPTIGINVRSDGDIDYASLIVDGKKKYESRKTDSLRPYVGKTVGIVRTGNGPAVAIGQVTIGEPIVVDAEKFNRLRKQHLVPRGSKFDIDSDGTKYLYPMINPVRWDNEKPIKSKGIVSRKMQEQDVEEGFFDRFKKQLSADRNGIHLTATKDERRLIVDAIYNDERIGNAIFQVQGKNLVAAGVGVAREYQGKGIGKIIYDWVKELGYTLNRSPHQTDAGKGFWDKHKGVEQNVWEASGYIPSEKEKNDPRFKTALTIDVKPDSIKKNAKAFGWLTSRAGIPPKANTNGKI